jgi:hypothetical protein
MSTDKITLTLIFHSEEIRRADSVLIRAFSEWHSFYLLVNVDLSGSDAICDNYSRDKNKNLDEKSRGLSQQ